MYAIINNKLFKVFTNTKLVCRFCCYCSKVNLNEITAVKPTVRNEKFLIIEK